jgi:hypothetical protein
VCAFQTNEQRKMSKNIFPFNFRINYCMYCHACYMSNQSRSPWLNNPNNVRCRVLIRKFLNLQFSPSFCHVDPFRSKYTPQHPAVLRPTQSNVLPFECVTKFHTRMKQMHEYFEYLNPYGFRLKTGKISDSEVNGRCKLKI